MRQDSLDMIWCVQRHAGHCQKSDSSQVASALTKLNILSEVPQLQCWAQEESSSDETEESPSPYAALLGLDVWKC